MRNRILALFPALLLALLAVLPAAAETDVLVFIEEGSGFHVAENGLRILPGEDAVFTLEMDRGTALTGTDYSGESAVHVQNRTVTLTLRRVLCPTRVRLSVSTKYCTALYDANGGRPRRGTETVVEKRFSLSVHRRPNTETDLFVRDGFTLLGWNTRSDGRGERIGLGSRVTPVNGEIRLYAQWAPWAKEKDFDWTGEESATITACRSEASPLVIPAMLGGKPVTGIASGAFVGCPAGEIVLPCSLETVAEGAFRSCALTVLTLFDSIRSIPDTAFTDCPGLQTLRINAAEAPFGYVYRKESAYADKAELLLAAQGRRKLVFYGGCSMWYNLDALQAVQTLGDEYAVINMGLNGTVSSAVQLQILGHFLEPGDILFHTPEISSRSQLMLTTGMGVDDSSLWCGLENNYDLFSLVDLRTVDGVFDSLCHYLGLKDRRTDYQQFFSDDYRTPYLDAYGSIPFYRAGTDKNLDWTDKVRLNPELLAESSLETLRAYYARLTEKGIRVLVSCACVNLDAVPEEQRGNAAEMDRLFRAGVEAVPGVRMISRLEDYLYHREDFYDTNYHLNTAPAKRNTAQWLADLQAALAEEGGSADAK